MATRSARSRTFAPVRAPVINGTLGECIQTLISFEIYRMLGPRPLAPKLFNAFLSALAVVVFSWTLSLAFPTQAALTAGLILAVWPSHIFYTSQNLKEAPVCLLAYAAIGATLAAGFAASAFIAGPRHWLSSR